VEKSKRQFVARAKGHVFFFQWDAVAPGLLHIYARHRKLPDDAIFLFFARSASQTWDDEHQRWERVLGNECVYWFWIDESRKLVQICSCFDVD
jgi:hypothetical protein